MSRWVDNDKIEIALWFLNGNLIPSYLYVQLLEGCPMDRIIVKWLINHGVDPNTSVSSSEKILDFYYMDEDWEMVKFLKNAGAVQSEWFYNELLYEKVLEFLKYPEKFQVEWIDDLVIPEICELITDPDTFSTTYTAILNFIDKLLSLPKIYDIFSNSALHRLRNRLQLSLNNSTLEGYHERIQNLLNRTVDYIRCRFPENPDDFIFL